MEKNLHPKSLTSGRQFELDSIIIERFYTIREMYNVIYMEDTHMSLRAVPW